VATAAKQRAASGSKKAAAKAATPSGEVVHEQVAVADLKLDSDVQPRTAISTNTINEYAEVYRDETGAMFVADGWHRVMGAKEAEQETINAEVRPGTKRDAILYSVSANATHGLRRTNDDKRRAVMRLLEDAEWSQWSDGVIAERVSVSQPFVSQLRSRLVGDGEPSKRTVRTSDGREMDTSNIGRRKGKAAEAPVEEANGHAPLSLVEDAEDAEDEEPVTGSLIADDGDELAENEEETVEQFATRFAAMMLRLDSFEPADVFAAMDVETRDQLADKWDDIIGSFDAYSGALEAALEPATA
jgi:hypothetical protein